MKESREHLLAKIEQYKPKITTLETECQKLSAGLDRKSGNTSYNRLKLAEKSLDLASNYLVIEALTKQFTGISSAPSLEKARKKILSSLTLMQQVVSGHIDSPFSDYAKYLEEIEEYDDSSRLLLLKKTGYALAATREAFGLNSRWRWIFVEMHGTFAVCAKNFLNLKTFYFNMDPSVPGYPERMDHLKLVRNLLDRAADEYKEKYEIVKIKEDFVKAIRFLEARRRIELVLNESEHAAKINKKLEVWKLFASRQK